MTARTPPRERRRARTDAIRNRQKLLEAARATYAESGAGASLKTVAARAGLGVGTVYRHFATPDALTEAVLADCFADLWQRAETLHAENVRAAALGGCGVAADALAEWLTDFIGRLGEYRGLAQIALPRLQDPASPLHASCRGMWAGAAVLLADAQRAGTIRADIDFSMVLTLANAVAWAVEHDPRQAPVAISVLLDGLRRHS